MVYHIHTCMLLDRNMVNFLEPQLKNSQAIKAIVKELDLKLEHTDGRELNTLLVYLPTKEGATCYELFFKTIKEGILSNFVFSCTEVEKKLGIKSKNTPEELFDRAIRKLSKHTAKGELGELILFTLLDVYFGAPKILSKVSMKTNPRMPVFGADAVHGQFTGDQFRLYLGEAKIHKNFKGAAKSAAGSINNAKEKYQDEFDLLDSYMDFPNIDKEIEEKLLSLLNPFTNEDLSDVIHSPCFIGFAEPDLISNAASTKEFLEKYRELGAEYIEDFFSKVEAEGLSIDEATLMLLPFSCIDQLVDGFVDYMGIKK